VNPLETRKIVFLVLKDAHWDFLSGDFSDLQLRNDSLKTGLDTFTAKFESSDVRLEILQF